MSEAYPHDGDAREKGTGKTLASIYKAEGLQMLDKHATFVGGGYDTEAGILELRKRMTTGRFKVFAGLREWFEEFRQYHRDQNGDIVKVADDLMSASRIACMSLRFAMPATLGPDYGGGPIFGGSGGRGGSLKYDTDFEI